ncbi:MAG TPA: substrate-binding domain-containing protein [Sedimentisphaerales bacterium]|nr:substrate-binding domain-containing protein [Sedimentisphaerales bacterium]
MKKLIIPLVILAVVMLVTSIVKRRGQRQLTDAVSGQKRAVSDDLYVEVSAVGNLDYFYDHKLGMELAGRILGVKTDYVGPAEYDMTAMITAFEQTLARKNLRGVVVVGFEPALVPIINKAVDSGIPVVTVDADLPYVNREDTPFEVDSDYFGRKRNDENPDAGPFEVPGEGRLCLKAWPVVQKQTGSRGPAVVDQTALVMC